MIQHRLGHWLGALLVLALLNGGCDKVQDPAKGNQEAVQQECIRQLRDSLHHENKSLQLVAADFLTSLGYHRDVSAWLAQQQSSVPDATLPPIDLWRIDAQIHAHDRSAYTSAIEQIVQVFLHGEKQERQLAAAALARLKYQFGESSDVRSEVQLRASEGSPTERAYALWILFNNQDIGSEMRLAQLLRNEDVDGRRMAAFVLRHQTSIQPETLVTLRSTLAKEPTASPARTSVLTAAVRHLGEGDPDRVAFISELQQRLKDGAPAEQLEVTRLAAEIGVPKRDSLVALLHDNDVGQDVKASAAQAICRIDRRRTDRMPMFDWFVVTCYGLGMLAVGIYYAGRTRSSGEYLLGGSNMKSWMVGLSLFATMLSTLSYLAWPGEMIKNGPMIMLGYASYPLVFFVVGWLLIPQIMKLPVTSAYEILEMRFGVSTRLLGSFLFLSLRFLWMASIIYWTTAIVLIPAAGLPDSYTGLVAMVLGILTVIYTSLGGIRAVVLTDVIQTFILFMGAIISLVIITFTLGGVGAWFPDHWEPHWTAPRLWFDFRPETRSTLANAMLGTFSWYVCTAGADQMAIQRYLATKDVKSARRMLAVSLSTDFLVIVFLGLMGLALLAFFSAKPEFMGDGQTVYANADKLFPRFVVVGLPLGLSGLVIAGLLAAAMSSLSSGVNSSAAVISEDFVRRLLSTNRAEPVPIRVVRWASVSVGVLVVLLSSQIGNVQGNMLEVVYKVANLFTAPLFYLFFMAMFVRRANTYGTWIGSIAGIATAVLIAFWKDFFGRQGISFLWIIPSSFCVSAMVGILASMLIGKGNEMPFATKSLNRSDSTV